MKAHIASWRHGEQGGFHAKTLTHERYCCQLDKKRYYGGCGSSQRNLGQRTNLTPLFEWQLFIFFTLNNR